MGYGLDMLFHTLWIRYVFLVLGAIAGFVETSIPRTDKEHVKWPPISMTPRPRAAC